MLTPFFSPPSSQKRAAAPLRAAVVAKSMGGTQTRVHQLDNHFAWLALSLHLSATKNAGSVGGGGQAKRDAADAGCVRPGPDGNHGDNDSSDSK